MKLMRGVISGHHSSRWPRFVKIRQKPNLKRAHGRMALVFKWPSVARLRS